MNSVIFLHENFPPKRMNANHNRLYHLAQFINNDHKVIIICPNNRFEYSESDFHGIKIIKFPYLNIKIIGDIIMIFSAKRYIKKILEKHNIKENMLWYNSVLSFDVSKNFKCKKVYDIMGINSNEILTEKTPYNRLKSLFYKKFEKTLYNNSDFIITINESHKKYLSRKFKGKIYIIRDAVDDTIDINSKLYKKISAEQKDNFNIFFVGSFNRKRFEKIIDSFKPLSLKIKNLKITIAGDGEYLKYYKDRIADLGLESFFNFIGHTTGKDLNAHIKAADVCISDVYLEGFPFKIFEYMQMGKTILVEETPGVKEVIKSKNNGLLYKNASEFENKVLMLANNLKLREKLGKKAQEDSEKHTWEFRQKEFKEILIKIKKENLGNE